MKIGVHAHAMSHMTSYVVTLEDVPGGKGFGTYLLVQFEFVDINCV